MANGLKDKIKDQGPPNVGGESSSNFLRAGRTNSGKRVLHLFNYTIICIAIIWIITQGCNMTMCGIWVVTIRCH